MPDGTVIDLSDDTIDKTGFSLLERLRLSTPTVEIVDDAEEKLRGLWLDSEREPRGYAYSKYPTPPSPTLDQWGSLRHTKRKNKQFLSPSTPKRRRRSFLPATPVSPLLPSKPVDTSPLKSLKRYDTNASPLKVWRNIALNALQPLGPRDVSFGSIYIFTVAGNEGLVKIGYTNGTVYKRMREWSRCRETILIYPSDPSDTVNIPYARRVEALIHAELHIRRMAHKCECGHEHTEWFLMEAEDAILTVRKWSEWIKTEPYEIFSPLAPDIRYLKDGWRKKFAHPQGYLSMSSLTVI